MSNNSPTESLEQFFLDYSDGLSPNPVRTLDIIDKERRLHHGPTGKHSRKAPMGLDRWSKKHEREVKHMGSLPYLPSLFPDQIINKPFRPVTRASIYLPETVYLKGLRKFYDLTLGSHDLAQNIIDGFDSTPAQEGESASITDWAVECLKNDISFGITSAHLESLSDIADMETGLSLAVAARKGRRYISNFKLLINKNMTRESFKKIPLPWLISTGLVPYWGLPPGKSLEENGISEELAGEVNRLMINQYRIDRELGSVALGFVLGGSRPAKIIDPETGQISGLMLPEPYTSSLAARCEGGIVVANRVNHDFDISGIVSVKKVRTELVDELHDIHASQASRLTGVPVGYAALSGEFKGQAIFIKAA